MSRTRADWQAIADSLSYRTQAFIDGRFVDAVEGQTTTSIAPATGQVLATLAECTAADVDVAVKAARRAFESGVWSRASADTRKATL